MERGGVLEKVLEQKRETRVSEPSSLACSLYRNQWELHESTYFVHCKGNIRLHESGILKCVHFTATRSRSIQWTLHVDRIGVVSGKAIFGPPLEEYWTKKLQEEASKKKDEGSS
ncbi:hypothetical protein MRB53_012527 [Persea americana]|uniref:Uncharacterized protein n=1 Tax=Persea americana TaxID=3435 RepID=A0ACC2LY13_PERAE|nr:hypothetical protein MRB53_012527 [Persea americana]